MVAAQRYAQLGEDVMAVSTMTTICKVSYGSWWQWGDTIVNISLIDFSNPGDHRIDEFERDNYEHNWPYLVEAENLYNLIQHGTGRASIWEQE